MLRGLYSAASGMTSNLLLQDVVSENLAHAAVPGYRASGVAFGSFAGTLSDLPQPPAPGAVPAASELITQGQLFGTTPTIPYFDFSPGPLVPTGNPLDLALTNNTFFVLDSPAGPVFTRDGAFRLNANNQIENSGGLLVRGQGGNITVPPNTAKITVSAEGRVFADGQPVDQIQLEVITSPAGLTRAGPALFTGRQPQSPPPAGTASVQQGYLEGSNVNPITQMIGMMTNLRFFEASQRALRSISDALGQRTRLDTGV